MMPLPSDVDPVQHDPLPPSSLFPPKKRHFVVLVFVAVLVGLFSAGVTFWVYSYAHSPCLVGSAAEVEVYIPPKTGFSSIQKILASEKVLAGDIRFRLLARYLGVSTRLKAGEYVFTAAHTPLSILRDLEQGKTVPRILTIAEGLNMYEVAQKIEDGGWGRKEEVLALLSDPVFLGKLAVSAKSLEGYLFPDTYFFERSDTPEEIIVAMVRRMRKVLAEECEAASGGAGVIFVCGGVDNVTAAGKRSSGSPKRLIFSLDQVLTLASIVEKETKFKDERPLVAKVFINRLRKGMRLQADPTVIYGLQKFGEQLSRKDLRTPTPYNTYTQTGLPAGPICNPGRASIAAVFNPSEEEYYYFVLQNGQGHYFSKSLKEHNRAVARLRKFEKEN